MPDNERWITRYEILNLCPAPPDLIVVFGHDSGDEPFTTPCPMLGVSRAVDVLYRGGREIRRREPYTAVVHLYLADGGWFICEDDSNFAGACMKGDDINALLPRSLSPPTRPSCEAVG